jgi:hypothetical protein
MHQSNSLSPSEHDHLPTSLCLYYQAVVQPEKCWFLVASLRSFEHVTFDRTLDKTHSLFEFFVPQDQDHIFREIMRFFIEQGMVTHMQQLSNRLLDPAQTI